jgi:hypothetical protein
MKARFRARTSLRVGILEISILVASSALTAEPIATVGDLLIAMRDAPGDSTLLVPVAGHVTGSRGEDFRSDLTLWASDGAQHTIVIGWVARDRDNRAVALDRLVIGPGPSSFPDFVVRTLGRTGLGAIAVAAVDESGAIDRTTRIFGASRVTSPGGCGANASIAVPAARVLPAGGNVDAFPLEPDARATLGIVNAESAARTWNVYAGFSGLATIDVPPFSMVQVPLELHGGPAYVSAGSGENVTRGTAYLATIRNDTGSGAVIPLAFQ